jgi:hypothetical protein
MELIENTDRGRGVRGQAATWSAGRPLSALTRRTVSASLRRDRVDVRQPVRNRRARSERPRGDASFVGVVEHRPTSRGGFVEIHTAQVGAETARLTRSADCLRHGVEHLGDNQVTELNA